MVIVGAKQVNLFVVLHIHIGKKYPVPSQEYGRCYIIVRFCVCYILTLCSRCVVCFLLYLSVNSNYYKTCHGTFFIPNSCVWF